MGRGKRYEGEPKLNLKKVFAVIIAFAVIIMFIVGIKKLMTPGEKIDEKQVAMKYLPVYTDGKWGVINSYGDIIIEPTYDETIIIPDNTKPVFICTYDVDYAKGTYKTKVLNQKNEEIITGYDSIEAIENYNENNAIWYEADCLKVKKDRKYGLIDFKGKSLTECEFTDIVSLKGTNNSLLTTKDGKKGIIDNTGAVIVENKYKNIQPISNKYENGYIVQALNGKYGVMNWNKTVAVDTKYEEIKPIYANGKYYAVKENKKWKVIDTVGGSYLTGKYDEIISIDDDYAIVKKAKKYGVVSILDGEVVVPISYDSVAISANENYIVSKNGKYGIVDRENSELLEAKYSNLIYRADSNFYEGTNADYTSDLMDTELNVKVTGIISSINTADGYMKVRVGDGYKYYNFKFEEKESKDVLKGNTIFLAKKDGKYGFVNKSGIVVVDYIYDDATEQNEFGYASVKKDGLWGCVNSKGEVKIAPSYNLGNNAMIEFIEKWHLGEDLNLNYYTDK